MRQACRAAITAALHVPYAQDIDPSPVCVCLGLSLFFLFFREKKEPKKRNLNGGMGRSNRAGRSRLCARRGEGDACKPSGGPSPSSVTHFPGGAFLKEKPRKMFFAGKVSAADGWARRAGPGGFPVFALVLFSPPERKENGKKIKKASPTAGVSGRRGGGRWLRGSRQSRGRRWSFRSTCRDRRRGGTARARRRRRYAPPPPAARRP